MFRKVACAVSGGVDSAVTIHLLAKRGLDVTGVYMNNWDSFDETGKCSSNQDMLDARKVCDTLKIPFLTIDFVRQYWLDVFNYLIESYQKGFTPNPDIVCNKCIKFGTFHEHAMELGFHAVATGHYAKSSFGDYLEKYDPCENVDLDARLLRPVDSMKDQTFFLSSISQAALRRTMFPLSKILKGEVRRIAKEIGLGWLNEKRESTGICMIGKRNFAKFIEEVIALEPMSDGVLNFSKYIAEKPGKIIDVDSGQIISEHKGIHYFTMGQRVKLPGQRNAHFVAKLSAKDNIVYVASSSFHPALYGKRLIVSDPHWVFGSPPENLQKNGKMICNFKFQHVQRMVRCQLGSCSNPADLWVTLDFPTRSLCLGQFAVFYVDNECLGSAEITRVEPLWYPLF
ncbi:unnamed protein product [Soboliphyme baturini]|uniref:tRNA-5-taurinomethyluridine 2-sulfurtransferase n=1 Tax=Soboliphyme baturini TaxID=241478 RepID=A0A183IUV3_9BILA|nr:unnamed protein product [Soboliphyme baturini]